MHNTRIKALFFDFDGVLIDTEVPAFQSWREIYEEFGQILALEDWAACLGTVGGFDPISHLEELTGTNIDHPEELTQRRWARKMDLLELEGLRPGLEDYLRRASELGLKVAIVSSDTDEWIATNFARLERGEEWHHVNCANGDVKRAKPLPCLYEETLAAFRLEPDQAVAFEDSPNGIQAAQAAGLYCIVVPNPVTRPLDLRAGDLHLNSFEQMSLDEILHRAEAGH